MNIADTERLFSLMREHGVTHFKSLEMEIHRGTLGVQSPESTPSIPDLGNRKSIAPPLQAAPPVESKIPHHVNEVANLLKLNDSDLVDKLFPDFSQMEPKE